MVARSLSCRGPSGASAPARVGLQQELKDRAPVVAVFELQGRLRCTRSIARGHDGLVNRADKQHDSRPERIAASSEGMKPNARTARGRCSLGRIRVGRRLGRVARIKPRRAVHGRRQDSGDNHLVDLALPAHAKLDRLADGQLSGLEVFDGAPQQEDVAVLALGVAHVAESGARVCRPERPSVGASKKPLVGDITASRPRFDLSHGREQATTTSPSRVQGR